jgi:protocatechuate 3,4-dioxygenase beta subunit
MTDHRDPDDRPLTRRRALLRLGGFAATTLGAGAWAADALVDADDAAAAGAGPAGVASGAVTCVLTPELTEGPYYIDGEKVRRDITEGKPGTPLRLRLTVVDASTCKPIKGATVDIWHADAGGVYSGFGAGSSNRTFMRGIQRTDAKGLALFRTVYPGWYMGRAVHIHLKVHLGGSVVHTGQLFFPERMTDLAYRKAPYSSRPGPDTRNANDSIFVNGGKRSLLKVVADGAGGYVGSLTMGVSRG